MKYAGNGMTRGRSTETLTYVRVTCSLNSNSAGQAGILTPDACQEVELELTVPFRYAEKLGPGRYKSTPDIDDRAENISVTEKLEPHRVPSLDRDAESESATSARM